MNTDTMYWVKDGGLMTKKIIVEWTNFDNVPCAKSFESEELARAHKVHLETVGIPSDSIYISGVNT